MSFSTNKTWTPAQRNNSLPLRNKKALLQGALFLYRISFGLTALYLGEEVFPIMEALRHSSSKLRHSG